MEDEFDDEPEGEINIPKVMDLSNKCSINSTNKKFNSSIFQKRRSLSTTTAPSFISNYSFYGKGLINNSPIIDKNKFFMKNEDNNSTTSKSSFNDKIKKVTFSTVEIIRVKNYKRYNKMNASKKVENEEDSGENINCLIF